MPQRFERNDLALIEKKIYEEVDLPQIGIVSEVYEHAAPNDDSNYEVDVKIDGGTSVVQRAQVLSPGTGSAYVPKVGDKVLVIFRAGEGNKATAVGVGWSNKDRPPVGASGMWREKFDSDTSPAGDGNLYVTGYTSYNESPASNDKRDLTPQETLVQIAKHAEGNNIDPSDQPELPAKVEFYDSPKNSEAYISVELTVEDGADTPASNTWGMKFNIKTGEWKLVGPSGFGITSDGAGNFVWEHKDITFDEKSGSTGSLSL